MKQQLSGLAQEIAEAVQNQPKSGKISFQDFYISIARDVQKQLSFFSAKTALTFNRNGKTQTFCIAVLINNAFVFLDSKTPANVTDAQGKELIARKMQVRNFIADIVREFLIFADREHLLDEPELQERTIKIYDLVVELDSFLLNKDAA
jgi:hypothetical protein